MSDVPAVTTIHLDARALRVLAHPLRVRLLSALRLDGPATATTLAGKLGTNTGATSYHLRQLAGVGLVTETGDGRGRQRWWRAATDMHSWTARDTAGDPDATAAADWLQGHYLRTFVDRYDRWLATQRSWPVDWQAAAQTSDWVVRVTPARLERLAAEIETLVERYLDPDPDDPDARPVQLYLHAVPTPRDAP